MEIESLAVGVSLHKGQTVLLPAASASTPGRHTEHIHKERQRLAGQANLVVTCPGPCRRWRADASLGVAFAASRNYLLIGTDPRLRSDLKAGLGLLGGAAEHLGGSMSRRGGILSGSFYFGIVLKPTVDCPGLVLEKRRD